MTHRGGLSAARHSKAPAKAVATKAVAVGCDSEV